MRFAVDGNPGNQERVLFSGLAGRTLAYVTIINEGPRAIRVDWDDAGAGASSAQSTPLMPGNSIMVAAGQTARVVYSPSDDPGDTGDSACGCYEIAWCCPHLAFAATPVAVAPAVAGSSAPPQPPGTTLPAPTLPAGTTTVSTPGGPELHVFDLVDDMGPQIPVRFVVGTPDNQPVDVEVEYSSGTGGFQTALPAINSDLMAGLAAPYLLANHRFVWDASGVAKGPAQLRLTAKSGTGTTAVTTSCSVDHTPWPPPAPYTPVVPVGATMTITGGDNQTGVCGQFLANQLEVQVQDSQKQPQPLANVFVGFTAFMGGQQYGNTFITTTGNDGKATSYLIGKKESGAGTVQAHIIGCPGQLQMFHCTLQASKILPFQWGPSAYATCGAPFTFAVYCDLYSDLALTTVNLTITAKSGKGPAFDPVIVDNSGILQQIGFQPWRVWNFTLIATEPDDTVAIVVTNADDPTVVPLQFSLKIGALPGMRRTSVTDYTPYPLQLKAATAAATVRTALTGFNEMTLQAPFQVTLTDFSRSPLTLEATDNFTGVCIPSNTRELNVTWSLLNSGGTLSDTPVPGTDNIIVLPFGKPVYFTPGAMLSPNDGRPWVLMAQIQSDHILDPNPLQFTDPATGNCTRDNVFLGPIGLTYCFVIRRPKVEFTKGAGANKKTVTSFKAGDRVHLEISGLSPTLATSPLPSVDLTANGGSLRSFTGPAGSLQTQQQFTMTHPQMGLLVSPEILITQGDPRIATPAALVLGVAPGGSVTASFEDNQITLGVDYRQFERKHAGLLGSIQESPLGTSPTSGANGTVAIRNGEFLYRAKDLDYATRAQPIVVSRIYRSQVRNDGPFGPGWFFNHGAWLGVPDDLTVRPFISSEGRYSELWTNRIPPKGWFIAYQQNFTFDTDSGPYQITDAHKNELHFNLDGSVRLTKDRLGNFYRYTYDENAFLKEIKDPHARLLTIDYWTENDPVEPETVGKIKTVTDPAGRKVSYEYYGKGDPNGAPGYLKKVTLPESPTLLKGAAAPDQKYPRTETYTYEWNANDRLDGRLLSVIDSEGMAWIVNRYGDESRVKEQDFGGGTFKFAYDLAALTTTVTDRGSNVTTYTFPQSPFPDGATPSKCETQPNGARVSGKVSTYTFDHNTHGALVRFTSPAGDEVLFAYEDRAGMEIKHGNLLALRKKSTAGQMRVWSYDYEDQYNLVTRTVDPRGNLPGINPEQYSVVCKYDYQLGTGSKGLLSKVTLPRVLNMIVAPPGSPKREVWIDENPTLTMTYNDWGSLDRETDASGVVTEYRYYPIDDPTGSGGGAAARGSGGLCGACARDVDSSPSRDLHLPNLPQVTRTVKWRYNQTGDPVEFEDARGVVTTFLPSKLHEITQVTLAARAPAPLTALSIVEYLDYDSHGRMVRGRFEQPSCAADTDAGGSEVVSAEQRDASEEVFLQQSTAAQGSTASARLLRDPNGLPTALRPIDAESGAYPNCGVAISWDERGLPVVISVGVDTSAAGSTTSRLFSAVFQISDNGEITQVATSGGAVADHIQDEFGYTHAVVDPLANVLRRVSDAAGMVSRVLTYVRDGSGSASRDWWNVKEPVGSFGETRNDEHGRVTRSHIGVFTPAPAASTTTTPATPIPNPTDNHPPLGTLPSSTSDLFWPPVASTTLKDGAWRAGDGRSTGDAGFDAWNLPSRVVDDELGFALIRRNSHGEAIEEVDCTGDITRRDYDAGGNMISVEIERNSTDTANPLKKIFKLWHEYDALGRLTRTIDGAGNAERAEYDETGWPIRCYDAAGPDSSDKTADGVTINDKGNVTIRHRDGLQHVKSIETKLAQNGTGSGLPGAVADTNPYNSSGSLIVKVEYEAGGAIKSVDDAAGRKMSYGYDPWGRPQGITFPVCAAAKGQTTSCGITYQPTTGFVDTTTDANGTTLRYHYDDGGRMNGISVDKRSTAYTIGGVDGFTIGYRLGAILAYNAGGGAATLAVYDSVGHLRSEVQLGSVSGGVVTGGRLVDYNYDGTGRRIYLGYPAGPKEVDYKRDAAGRAYKITDGVNTIAAYTYLGRERVLKRTGGGLTFTYTFRDGDGVLSGVAIDGVGGGTIQYDLKSDRMGRLTKQTRTVGGGAADERTWTYDSTGRVVSETTPLAATLRFYDANNVLREERVTPAGGIQTISLRTPEERGRIIQIDGKTMTYDLNGNLIDDGDRKMVYDAWNRLVSVTRSGAAITYEYDAWNRRVTRTAGGHKEQYVYDGWQLIEVWLDGKVSEHYYYGEHETDLLQLFTGNKTYLVLLSPQGSVDALVDINTKAIAERYEYSLSGGVTVYNASGVAQPGGTRPIARPLLQGHLYDFDAGLYDCRNRWYHPGLGQFLTPDSADNTAPNRYWMDHGDPINFSDPTGLEEEKTFKVYLQGAALNEATRQYYWEHNLGLLRQDIRTNIATLQRQIVAEGPSMMRSQLLSNAVERLNDIDKWEAEGGAEYSWERDTYDFQAQQNCFVLAMQFHIQAMATATSFVMVTRGFSQQIDEMLPKPPPMRGAGASKAVPVGFRSVAAYKEAWRQIRQEEERLAKLNAVRKAQGLDPEPFRGPRGGMFGYATKARGLIRNNLARYGMTREPGHVGVTVGQINGKPIYRVAPSGECSPEGMVPCPAKASDGRPITTLEFKPKSGNFRWGDSEFRTLEELRNSLPPGSKGELWMSLEKDPCTSCFGAMQQFRQEFPKINIITNSRGMQIPQTGFMGMKQLRKLPLDASTWYRWHPIE